MGAWTTAFWTDKALYITAFPDMYTPEVDEFELPLVVAAVAGASQGNWLFKLFSTSETHLFSAKVPEYTIPKSAM